MGLSDERVGSLVWVRRRNGTWWPGRVVPHSEAPSSSALSSTSKAPVRLLGKEHHSVDWYDLEQSKRVKAFRCGEFEACIEQAQLSKEFAFLDDKKYVRRTDAILHALALEKKEQQKKNKRTGAGQVETGPEAKRSRFAYLPIQSQSSKLSTFRVESDDSTFVSGVSLPMETESHSSSNCQDNDVQTLGHSLRRLRSMKLKKHAPNCQTRVSRQEKQKGTMQKGTIKSNCRGSPSTAAKRSATKILPRKTSSPLAVDALSQETRCTSEPKSVGNLEAEASPSALGGSNFQVSDIDSFGSASSVPWNGVKMMLIDVDVSIEQSCRSEHVPFICLVSAASKKAIIGHPVDIEALQDNSETRHSGIPERLFGDTKSGIFHLTWKTSRRTPVRYISNSQSPATPEDGKGASTIQRFCASKETKMDLTLCGKSYRKSTSKNAFKHRGSSNDNPQVTCVPVKVVFSKLFRTVGKL